MKTEIIAEFMGAKFDATISLGRWVFHEQQPTPYYREDANHVHLRYDSDWNWLMPVVEKIEEIEEPYSLDPTRGTIWPYQVEILSRQIVQIIDHRTDEAVVTVNEHGLTKIQSVCKAVIAFIKWYNDQSTGSK